MIIGENRPSLLKSGLFTIAEVVRERSYKRANTLFSIRPFITKSGSLPKGFISALNTITDENREKEVIDGIAKKGGIYPKVIKKEAYEQLLSFLPH